MAAPQTAMVQPAPRGMRGHVRPPGDKAISHRYALLAALADGRSDIRGYSTGGDCASTVRCLRALGVTIEETGRDTSGLQLSITGRGLGGLQPPTGLLDAGNYSNSQQFNEISTELNRIVETRVVPALKNEAVIGRTIQFAGCAEITDDSPVKPPLRVIPLDISIQ